MGTSSFAILSLLVPIFWLLVVVGLTIAVILAVRALRGIDRSLRELVEQGVARGEGPFDPPPAR